MEKKQFKCVVCGIGGVEPFDTGKRPRDRKGMYIVECPLCHHRQLFPLLSEEELSEEYAKDVSVRMGKVKIAEGSDFETMREKFSEWTKMHADMYYEKLQEHKNIIDLGSGYGFFEEELNNRKDKKFNIEGIEIGDFRLQNYVGGKVHKLNLMTDEIPEEMRGKYDLVISMHLLEHLNDPVQYLKKVRLLLASDSELLFEVPNLNAFLGEISPEYNDFIYLYEHVSYFTKDTLKLLFERAGYKVRKVYSREIYSIENHINWVRTGKPFIKYNQMFLPDERLEFINREYKKRIGEMEKGYSLIIECELGDLS